MTNTNTNTKFKPMLACEASLDDIRYPVLASPKLDGIRCVIVDGKALTRSLKEIPNRFCRQWLEANCPNGWDGELMLPRREDETLPDFNQVQSAIMSRDGEPNFRFYVFDNYLADGPYTVRLGEVVRVLESKSAAWMRSEAVLHVMASGPSDLMKLCASNLAAGYEGTMVRDPGGTYKFGRSTIREGGLLKLKPFIDEEATVIGVEELMRNGNEQKRDERGYAKRSSAKAGKVPAGMLGALLCRTDDGVEFSLGSGFTEKQRRVIWEESSFGDLVDGDGWPIGARVTFKMQKPPGRRDREPGTAPRCPVFKAFRSALDMSA